MTQHYSFLKSMALKLSLLALVASSFTVSDVATAQTKRNPFQTGEELVYKVKYGPVKLGTVVIKTGAVKDGQANARMQFWTSDVPFLDTKSTVTNWMDTKDISVLKFEEQSKNGDKQTSKHFEYDKAAKTLTYSDEKIKNQVTPNVQPFNDALSLLFNMRAWSSAAGHRYSFEMRNHDGVQKVVVNFTNKISNEEVPALDDKEVRTRVLEGQADMGSSSPLGANGAFTAYVSDDAAAIPVKIEMQIAVGSITLILDKVKRPDWTAAK